MNFNKLLSRPVLAAVIGAFVISGSGALTKQSLETPSTIALWRCIWALPLLAFLSHRETLKYGKRVRRDRILSALAGVAFTFDLVMWHYSIHYIGAGMATVLGNMSSVVVAIIAWVFLKERPATRLLIVLPFVLLGVTMTTGALGGGADGINPALGVIFGIACSIAYGIFIVVYRAGGKDDRRIAGPLFDATLFGAFGSLLFGPFVDSEFHLFPNLHSQIYLFALGILCQVLGWLIISIALPRLPAALTALILLIQPLGGMAFAVVLLGEHPTLIQILGGAVILAGVLYASRAPRAASATG